MRTAEIVLRERVHSVPSRAIIQNFVLQAVLKIVLSNRHGRVRLRLQEEAHMVLQSQNLEARMQVAVNLREETDGVLQ